MTLLSTTSSEDLAFGNNDLVRFSKVLPDLPEEKYLAFPNKWFIGSQAGCSCSFRHLYVTSVELGFGTPEDWYPEKVNDIAATHQVITLIRSLVEKNEEVDLIDAWADGKTEALPLDGDIEVNLKEVSNESFRFFENHRFSFESGT
jgi:hypothetical protein